MDRQGVKAGIVMAVAGAIVFAFGIINFDVTGSRIFGGFGLMGLVVGVAFVFDRI